MITDQKVMLSQNQVEFNITYSILKTADQINEEQKRLAFPTIDQIKQTLLGSGAEKSMFPTEPGQEFKEIPSKLSLPSIHHKHEYFTPGAREDGPVHTLEDEGSKSTSQTRCKSWCRTSKREEEDSKSEREAREPSGSAQGFGCKI
jgi:hypothetical protein